MHSTAEPLGLKLPGIFGGSGARDVVDPNNTGLRFLTEGKWRTVPGTGSYPPRYSLFWHGYAKPTTPLPRIGGTATSSKDSALYEKMRNFLKKARHMTQEEFLKAPKSLFEQVDRDYTLMKESLSGDPEVSGWFKRGYDIMPDLNEGTYVWVYTGVRKASSNAQPMKRQVQQQQELGSVLSLPLGELNEEEGEIPLVEGCDRIPTLKVDVFFDNKPLSSGDMPLHWDRLVENGVAFTDLLQDAKEWLNVSDAHSISVYKASSKPPKPIDWYARTLYTRHWVGCRDVKEMKNQYIAIGLSQAGYRCSICDNKALFANTVFMKSFCGEVCHKIFLDQNA